jgi:hypothetical protein
MSKGLWALLLFNQQLKVTKPDEVISNADSACPDLLTLNKQANITAITQLVVHCTTVGTATKISRHSNQMDRIVYVIF